MARPINRFLRAALIAELALAMPVPSFAQGVDKYQEVRKPGVQPRTAPTKPAAKPAEPAEPAPPATPPALDRQPLVIELMRKAQAREDENGFCLRTNWSDPSGGNAPAFFDRQAAGDTWVITSNRACTFGRI